MKHLKALSTYKFRVKGQLVERTRLDVDTIVSNIANGTIRPLTIHCLQNHLTYLQCSFLHALLLKSYGQTVNVSICLVFCFETIKELF
jgi:hypothetical protein